MSELTVTSPDGRTRVVRLDSSRVCLGRAAENELSFPEDVGLSRQHLSIERDGDGWLVKDLQSKNGTYVNGERITGNRPLRPGDRVAASRVVLVYSSESVQADRTVLFDRAADTGHFAESTTLQNLLARQRAAHSSPSAAAATPAPGWGAATEALIRAGREIAARRPLGELFQVLLDLSIEAVSAERGVLMTSEKGQLVAQASRGRDFRISNTVRDRVLNSKTSLLVRDTQQDELFREQKSIVAQRVRSFMAVPLQTDERVIGLIYIDTPPLFREFTSDDLNLLTVMANIAAIRIERERLAEVEATERLMFAELEQAAEIQRRFLPSGPPVAPGLDVAGYNAACRTVGGDYYDFIAYPDGRLSVVIGDVAGKGMPAALMMTSLQAKVQAFAEAAWEPAALVTRLNKSLAATCPGNRFVTFFFGLANAETGDLAFCNAGHNPPLLIRNDGQVLQLEGGGPVLGILRSFQYEQRCARLEPGDMLLLYSDGVTEAPNPQDEEFGEDRLLELAKRHHGERAETVVAAVHQAVAEWAEGRPASDDITVVAVRRLG